MATKETTEALAPPDTGPTALVLMSNPPAAVLAEAHIAARALADVLASKDKKVMMNGEQYLEFEDWQTLGRFYGITAKEDGDPEFVDLAGVLGFKVSAVAIDSNDRVLSRATAYCLNDEEKWSTRAKYAWAYVLADGSGHSVEDPGSDNITWVPNPDKPGRNRPLKEKVLVGEERVPLFQLSSMAQTRAGAKVLRNVLSWVVVLAGYRATPAEELNIAPTTTTAGDVVDAEVTGSTAQGQPAAQAKPAAAKKAAPAGPAPATQQNGNGGGKLPRWSEPCPRCGMTGTVIVSTFKPGYYHCWKGSKPAPGCSYDFTPEDAQVHAGAGAQRAESGLFEGGGK